MNLNMIQRFIKLSGITKSMILYIKVFKIEFKLMDFF